MSLLLRQATVADAREIATHRALMFHEMGQLPEAAMPALVADTEALLEPMLATGEYVGWLAAPADDPHAVAGGAGAQRRQVLPHPDGAGGVAEGQHAIVLNVWTEPRWRRQGVAVRLMEAVLAWAREEQLDRLVLHASDAGRPLYERLGFVRTNEMRYTHPLR
ncbi:MAG: GNAT family N-acetyltransferase [Gemmatimonadales bacterium]|nr:GNAT family N-acetyltransferase [Gemmatimonadales bacterium]